MQHGRLAVVASILTFSLDRLEESEIQHNQTLTDAIKIAKQRIDEALSEVIDAPDLDASLGVNLKDSESSGEEG